MQMEKPTAKDVKDISKLEFTKYMKESAKISINILGKFRTTTRENILASIKAKTFKGNLNSFFTKESIVLATSTPKKTKKEDESKSKG